MIVRRRVRATAAAVASVAFMVSGCTAVVHGRGTQGAALPMMGLQHTLCAVITPGELGSTLDLVAPQPAIAAFRLRPPAEDGCVVSFSTADVSLSISIDPVTDSQIDQRLARDPQPALLVTGIGSRRGVGEVTVRSGVALAGGHLVDVTVDPTHGAPHASFAAVARLLSRAVQAYRSVQRLSDVATLPWCQAGATAAAGLLGGSPQVQRAEVTTSSRLCGWATPSSGVIVTQQAQRDASAYVTRTLGGHRYHDTVIADDGSSGLVAVVDRSHVMTILFMANGDSTVEPDQVYPLFAALRKAMG